MKPLASPPLGVSDKPSLAYLKGRVVRLAGGISARTAIARCARSTSSIRQRRPHAALLELSRRHLACREPGLAASNANTIKSSSSHRPNNGEPKCQISLIFTASFRTSLRWNAETGVLGISVFNPESGEREVQEIQLGNTATFAMDLATRERGYGLIKVGVYDMKLTPVGSPAPAWPGDEEYKPALGCWLWNPAFGELRLETNAAIFRTADRQCLGPGPVCTGVHGGLAARRSGSSIASRVPVKSVNKTFFGPVIEIVGWTERDKVPGWRERAPTVPPPAAPPLLAASSAPASGDACGQEACQGQDQGQTRPRRSRTRRSDRRHPGRRSHPVDMTMSAAGIAHHLGGNAPGPQLALRLPSRMWLLPVL